MSCHQEGYSRLFGENISLRASRHTSCGGSRLLMSKNRRCLLKCDSDAYQFICQFTRAEPVFLEVQESNAIEYA